MAGRRWQVSAVYRTQGHAATAGRLRSTLGRDYRFSCTARDELVIRATVRAQSPEEAVSTLSARVLAASSPSANRFERAHVWPASHLPLRRRRAAVLVGARSADGDGEGDDGAAGVREPRRPLGSPPALSCARNPDPQRVVGPDAAGSWAAA